MQSEGPGRPRDVSDATLESDAAELSALAGTLDDVTNRIGQIAYRYQGTTREDLAHSLFEVERSLLNAVRRLDRVRRPR
jgi:hypothetical protein